MSSPGLNRKVGPDARANDAAPQARSREVPFDDAQVWPSIEVEGSRRSDGGRRLLNLSVAAIGILLTAPLMVIVAVAIKATSRGPVIFRQQRVGLDRRARVDAPRTERRSVDQGGRVFTMLKFRTMYHLSHNDAQVWTRPGDPRITPVGKVLRTYRLDELPQLFNVLKGDMNVVGPRPEQPRIFSRLAERFGPYRMRQRVLPGITGMAQVALPPDQSLDDVRRKVDMDLEYIQSRGLLTDLKIMISTIKVLLFGRDRR